MWVPFYWECSSGAGSVETPTAWWQLVQVRAHHRGAGAVATAREMLDRGTRAPSMSAALPDFGLRLRHSGGTSLRDWLREVGVDPLNLETPPPEDPC